MCNHFYLSLLLNYSVVVCEVRQFISGGEYEAMCLGQRTTKLMYVGSIVVSNCFGSFLSLAFTSFISAGNMTWSTMLLI